MILPTRGRGHELYCETCRVKIVLVAKTLEGAVAEALAAEWYCMVRAGKGAGKSPWRCPEHTPRGDPNARGHSGSSLP